VEAQDVSTAAQSARAGGVEQSTAGGAQFQGGRLVVLAAAVQRRPSLCSCYVGANPGNDVGANPGNAISAGTAAALWDTSCVARVKSLVASLCAYPCVLLSPFPRIDNPKYKGIWVAPDIDNPDFKDDPKLYLQKDIKYIGFELWQVRLSVCGGQKGGCLGPCGKRWEGRTKQAASQGVQAEDGWMTRCKPGSVCCCNSLVACWCRCVAQQADGPWLPIRPALPPPCR
jgi:hypothetical protein